MKNSTDIFSEKTKGNKVGIQYHMCSVCQKCFKKRCDLTQHMKVHKKQTDSHKQEPLTKSSPNPNDSNTHASNLYYFKSGANIHFFKKCLFCHIGEFEKTLVKNNSVELLGCNACDLRFLHILPKSSMDNSEVCCIYCYEYFSDLKKFFHHMIEHRRFLNQFVTKDMELGNNRAIADSGNVESTVSRLVRDDTVIIMPLEENELSSNAPEISLPNSDTLDTILQSSNIPGNSVSSLPSPCILEHNLKNSPGQKNCCLSKKLHGLAGENHASEKSKTIGQGKSKTSSNRQDPTVTISTQNATNMQGSSMNTQNISFKVSDSQVTSHQICIPHTVFQTLNTSTTITKDNSPQQKFQSGVPKDCQTPNSAPAHSPEAYSPEHLVSPLTSKDTVILKDASPMVPSLDTEVLADDPPSVPSLTSSDTLLLKDEEDVPVPRENTSLSTRLSELLKTELSEIDIQAILQQQFHLIQKSESEVIYVGKLASDETIDQILTELDKTGTIEEESTILLDATGKGDSVHIIQFSKISSNANMIINEENRSLDVAMVNSTSENQNITKTGVSTVCQQENKKDLGNTHNEQNNTSGSALTACQQEDNIAMVNTQINTPGQGHLSDTQNISDGESLSQSYPNNESQSQNSSNATGRDSVNSEFFQFLNKTFNTFLFRNSSEKVVEKNENKKNRRGYHTEKDSYSCIVCGKIFNRRFNLKVHLQVHSNEKQFKCNQCEKTFKRVNLLKNHIRTKHTPEKPFVCDKCGKGFIHQNYLDRHLTTHANFNCRCCNLPFKCRNMLYLHIKSHHMTSDSKYRCEKCDLDFKSKVLLSKHLQGLK